MGSARLYLAVAVMAYQRRLAYRTANLAGLVTNAGFGYLRMAVFLALFQAQPVVAGYDAREMITYSWLLQSILMVVQLWGWFEVEETIRSGDVVSDLSKPFSYLGYWLAQDAGRAAYYVVYRGAPIFLLGHLTMGLDLPSTPLAWGAAALSLVLATLIGFAWRFALNLSAFWTTDARGICHLGAALVSGLSGFVVPIPFFPEPVRSVLLALPFAGAAQTTLDIFLERAHGEVLVGLLARQAFWAAAMLLLCQLIVLAATRRVVVQGG